MAKGSIAARLFVLSAIWLVVALPFLVLDDAALLIELFLADPALINQLSQRGQNPAQAKKLTAKMVQGLFEQDRYP